MTSARRRTGSSRRLTVIVATPDGGVVSPRGLAAWLMRAAPARARGEVTVALVNDRRMRTLNRAFRGKDYATDVLSFPIASTGTGRRGSGVGRRGSGVGRRGSGVGRRMPGVASAEARSLGDIVIATGVAGRQAQEAGHRVATELRVLALHGLLHLLGYDHERDQGQMARLETKLRRAAGLTDGLIERRR